MSKIDVVAVIGEGKMGTNLFQYIASFPYELLWVVSPDADLGKIRLSWSKKVLRYLNTNIIDEPTFSRMNRAVITVDLNVLSRAGLIIEAIPEQPEEKAAFFRRIDKIAPSSCIFASNSSSIIPSALCPSEERRPAFIGLHFFYPVSLKNMVELIVHDHVSPETMTTVKAFLDTLERRYLVQNESNAFVLNRVFLEFQQEAWQIVSEGILTPAAVDALIHDRFFPLGVFECFDAVGIDIIAPSIRNYIRHDPDKAKYDNLLAKLDERIAAGKLGIKSGEGFFSYHPEFPVAGGLLPDLPPQPLAVAEQRLRAAMDHAMERFAAVSDCSKTELEAAVAILTGA